MRALVIVLAVQVVLGGTFIALSATGNLPFVGDDDAPRAAGTVPRPALDRFDSARALISVRRQVALGPRPAGSRASRELARRIRRTLPGGSFQTVPGGLRNVIGRVPGRDPKRVVVVGAHYDTKDAPGFVGANDGAAGVAVMTGIARALKPRRLRSTVVFIAFDGEESPRGTPDELFEARGLRGSKAAAPKFRDARAMILLDFVGEKGLRVPYEDLSDPALWKKLRAASSRAGVARVFPPGSQGGISDDHVPFLRQGVPSIDLIDFDYDCFHRRCDNLSQISEKSLDAVGETVLELLPTL
ncbi:MAG: Zn-dependent exopeptidase M28 [Thermoleophilaceae bacterium]|nr:Zn-dependent exopeptidase M28 [Thermoleophilaceae bacterium]